MPGRKGVIVFLSLVLVRLASAQSSGSIPDSIKSLRIPAVRVHEPMNIDGLLNESLYQGPGFTKFTERDPAENLVPSQRTEVWVGYDDAALYIGARMYDTSPDSIDARLTRKDVQIMADQFYFAIDAYHDKLSGFFFGLNAAGTMYDGTLYNDDWNDNSWDGVWEGKTHIDEHGWTAEMRIPYSQIRFTQGGDYNWAVNFERVVARRAEYDYVVFTPRNGSGFVSRFVDLTGVEGIDPPRRLEVLPYVTGKAEYAPYAQGDPFNSGSKYTPSVGADFKMGIGSNLTVDGAINPDFGQVEVDPAVVNLSDVETYFNEKRPFFLEGANIFNFGQGGASNNWSFNWSNPSMFYTRRIGRTPQGSISNADYEDVPNATSIIGAAKLSGKLSDGWSVGGLSAVTARETADVDSAGIKSTREVEPLTYYGAARVLKEFNEGREGLGMMTTLTERDFQSTNLANQINQSGLMAGLDGWTSLDQDKTWVITMWGTGTHVAGSQASILALQQDSQHYYQRPDASEVHFDSLATSINGYGGRMFISKQKGNFTTNASLGVLSPGFDVDDMGFQWRTDVINSHVGARYAWSQPTSAYNSMAISAALFRTFDFSGATTWQGVWQSFDYVTTNFYDFGYSYAFNPAAMNINRTRGGPITVNPQGYEISPYINGDSRQNLIPGASFDSYQSSYETTYYTNVSLDWKPSSNLEVIFSPELDEDWENSQWVGNFTDAAAKATYGTRYVFGEMNQKQWVASFRVNWAFTPVLSLQMYVQPLLSAGKLTNFKELSAPGTYNFKTYGKDAGSISYNDTSTEYTVNPGGGGAQFSFSNPDFNVKSVRGDAVLRWEFIPGSTFYLVWTQSRENDLDPGNTAFNGNFHELFRSQPDNIFLMKIAYWMNP